MGERMARASRALDVQTGGGEVLAGIPQAPPVLQATEGWAPNVVLARERLAALGAEVVEVDERADLPFADSSFDLVVSRHPATVRFDEIGRVLAAGGTYFAQHVGAGSVFELAEFMHGGPLEPNLARDPERERAAAAAAGLRVVDLRPEALRMEFFDVAAVIVFLRKVIWTVPDFTVERYRDRLLELHLGIERDGPFVAHSQRFLIEAVKA
ncbi:methyltransferase type 11 [Paractinoplanes rishiriensis]|uniref:Methyltransferase type 11 n=2 Tax=Paractinoplanes rishiriensis TaxID=1050105 RepID=A0A919JZP6_9ACTN|nr:methyltransferase type 11 [Actinoplanes rishiriensis]